MALRTRTMAHRTITLTRRAYDWHLTGAFAIGVSLGSAGAVFATLIVSAY